MLSRCVYGVLMLKALIPKEVLTPNQKQLLFSVILITFEKRNNLFSNNTGRVAKTMQNNYEKRLPRYSLRW
jgi:hypothetical protein